MGTESVCSGSVKVSAFAVEEDLLGAVLAGWDMELLRIGAGHGFKSSAKRSSSSDSRSASSTSFICWLKGAASAVWIEVMSEDDSSMSYMTSSTVSKALSRPIDLRAVEVVLMDWNTF